MKRTLLALVIASLGAGMSACVFSSQDSETAGADESARENVEFGNGAR